MSTVQPCRPSLLETLILPLYYFTQHSEPLPVLWVSHSRSTNFLFFHLVLIRDDLRALLNLEWANGPKAWAPHRSFVASFTRLVRGCYQHTPVNNNLRFAWVPQGTTRWEESNALGSCHSSQYFYIAERFNSQLMFQRNFKQQMPH